MTALEILKTFYGYNSFRPGQAEIVAAVLAGREVVALLPTGGGKSICFQVPGLVLGGTTVVVSPLISLMVDQVAKLESLGIKATHLSSNLPLEDQAHRLQLLEQGYWQFVYLSPEKLQSRKLLAAVEKIIIPLVAIDEAHCISEWGSDFRPEYRQIATFLQTLPTRPNIIAVTATATVTVVQDIVSSLGLTNPQVFTQSFKRENIAIKLISCETRNQKNFQLIYWLKRFAQQNGIIYSLTRQAAAEVVKVINHFLPDYQVGLYHGGLSAAERSLVQAEFLNDNLQLISATSAFGMGIDKANIRFVIHNQLPLTMEEFYQEIGRAGRDGLPANALLLFHPPDADPAWSMVEKNGPKESGFKKLLQFCQLKRCRQQELLTHFGEKNAPRCEKCDICLPGGAKALPEEQIGYREFSRNISRCFHGTHNNRRTVISDQALEWLYLLKPQTPEECLRIPGLGTGWAKDVWPLLEEDMLI